MKLKIDNVNISIRNDKISEIFHEINIQKFISVKSFLIN